MNRTGSSVGLPLRQGGERRAEQQRRGGGPAAPAAAPAAAAGRGQRGGQHRRGELGGVPADAEPGLLDGGQRRGQRAPSAGTPARWTAARMVQPGRRPAQPPPAPGGGPAARPRSARATGCSTSGAMLAGCRRRQRCRRRAVPEPPREQARPARRPVMRHLDGRLVPDPPARLVQPPDQVDVLAVAQRRVEDGSRPPATDVAARRAGPAARRSARRRPGWPAATRPACAPRSRLPQAAASCTAAAAAGASPAPSRGATIRGRDRGHQRVGEVRGEPLDPAGRRHAVAVQERDQVAGHAGQAGVPRGSRAAAGRAAPERRRRAGRRSPRSRPGRPSRRRPPRPGTGAPAAARQRSSMSARSRTGMITVTSRPRRAVPGLRGAAAPGAPGRRR